MTSPTKALHDAGQSLWLDNITRTMLDDGDARAAHHGARHHRA